MSDNVWDAFSHHTGTGWIAIKDERPLTRWERFKMRVLRRPDPRTVQVYEVEFGTVPEDTAGMQTFEVSFDLPDSE